MLNVFLPLEPENVANIEEAIEAGREVMVIGANKKVKSRLEKLGIAGIIPEDHWLDDRLFALKSGLQFVQRKLDSA